MRTAHLNFTVPIVTPPVEDDLHHVYYDDDPDWSLCGLDLSAHPEVDVTAATVRCVVCAEMEAALLFVDNVNRHTPTP